VVCELFLRDRKSEFDSRRAHHIDFANLINNRNAEKTQGCPNDFSARVPEPAKSSDKLELPTIIARGRSCTTVPRHVVLTEVT